MKPDNIILVRHGESEANVNKNLYATKPDYAMELTENGKAQALQAGKDIFAYLKTQPSFDASPEVQFYNSPFWRARQTTQLIEKSFSKFRHYEDPRLREQEWTGGLAEYSAREDQRDSFGHFYYRFAGGESCADVFDRLSGFMDTLHRDFQKSNCPRNVIIVNHGMTLRVFLMRWFHMTVEEFELLANPKNAEFFILKLDTFSNRYRMDKSPRKHEIKHQYQYDWKKLT